MRAIITKYHGPTNTRGSRITAKAYGGQVTVPYDSGLDSPRNHAMAAEALRVKLGMPRGAMAQGELPAGTGYAFVLASFTVAGS